MSARGPDNENLVLHIHGVISVLEFCGSQWSRRLEGPILDGMCSPAPVTMCWEKIKERTNKRRNELSWVGRRKDLYL